MISENNRAVAGCLGVEQLRTNELSLVVSHAADDQSVGVSLFFFFGGSSLFL